MSNQPTPGQPTPGQPTPGRPIPRQPMPGPTTSQQKTPQTSAAPSETSSADAWTVRKVLEWTTGHLRQHGSESPRLEAEILLAHARGCQRIQLYTAYDEPLADDVRATMRDLVKRRAQREPVAYLVGHREFFSLDFRVTKDVLIPRPDTETLVTAILESIKTRCAKQAATGGEPVPIRVLDLCTGSGCVAIAVAKNCAQTKLSVEITATDISPAALAIARENAVKHQVDDRITFVEGDLFAALPTGSQFDILASNPPYIATAEIDTLDPEVAKHEPRLALDGGPTGYEVYDRLIAAAPTFASPQAELMLELSPEQADPLKTRLENQGAYTNIIVRKDLANRPRVLVAEFSVK